MPVAVPMDVSAPLHLSRRSTGLVENVEEFVGRVCGRTIRHFDGADREGRAASRRESRPNAISIPPSPAMIH